MMSEEIDLSPGASLGGFRVFQRVEEEILIGEDDRHLDFRVSVLRKTENECSWVIISTVVRYNNWLGKVYFNLIRPFHKLIVPAVMRRGIKML